MADDDDHGAGGPLPSQVPCPRAEPSEMELYRAILRSAAEDLGSPNSNIRVNAIRWFQDTHCGSPLSLCDVCRVLDLNPRRISGHALRWAGLH
jgi:hypothetical protein